MRTKTKERKCFGLKETKQNSMSDPWINPESGKKL